MAKSTKRTEKQILDELTDAQQAYHKGHEQEINADKMKSLRAELGAYLSRGAVACSVCGSLPHGVRRASKVAIGEGVEVGCLHCASRYARGIDVEAAVDAWNEMQEA